MSTPKSRTSKTADESGNDKDICGATNRNGNPCKLPAGWGTPGSGGTRCKYHGGLSTGPDDTSHLENNDFAEGNPGGRPPENNDNAAIHGGFSEWEAAYERFQADPDARERIEKLVCNYIETASEHADDLDDDRRERLARELATRRLLKQRAQEDVWNDGDNSSKVGGNNDTDARGLLIEDDTGHGGGRSTPRTSQRINISSEPVRLPRNCVCGRGFNSPRTSPGVVTARRSWFLILPGSIISQSFRRRFGRIRPKRSRSTVAGARLNSHFCQ